MAWNFFRTKEVRWTQAALEEILNHHEILRHFEIIKRAKKLVDSEWCREGFERGFSASQVACVAVLKSAEEAIVYGPNVFIYRGTLTRNGLELQSAHRLAAQLLLDSGFFDQSQFDETCKMMRSEIEGMG